MRVLTAASVLLVVAALVAAVWLLSGHSPARTGDRGVSTDGAGRGATDLDGPPVPDPSIRVPVAAAASEVDWLAIASRWLFEPDVAAGTRLKDGVASGRLTADAAGLLLFELLEDDVREEPPRLRLDVPVATFLRQNARPRAELVACAQRYVGNPVPAGCHSTLQALLAGWPCFDATSCQAALAAAIAGLDDEAVWALLRDRLVREGSAALDDIVAASVELAVTDATRVDRLTLVIEAVCSFADGHDARNAVIDVMGRLGEVQLAGAGAGGPEVAGFGVWGPSMSAWGLALRACLNGQPGRPDAASLAARQRLIHELLDAPWPDDPARANTHHRLVLGLADGRDDVRMIDYLRRVATHSALPGTRIGALAKLGTSLSVAELERVYTEIVAADAAAIRDPMLRVGFYASVNNARIRDPGSRDDAVRLFAACLGEDTATDCQRFVLEALARNPLPELAWAVEQLAYRPGSSQLADLAARTLRVLVR